MSDCVEMNQIVMDSIIPEDYFITDKTSGMLLQNGNTDSFEIPDSGELNSEPIFTEYMESGTTWTIDGVPVQIDEVLKNEQDIPMNTEEMIKLENFDPNTETFPIEIPGKGFITSSGLFLTNELLLQLNLQNTNFEILDKPIVNKVEVPFDTPEECEEIEGGNSLEDFIEIVSMHKCKNCGSFFERYDDIIEHLEKNCHPKIVPQELIPAPRVQKMSSLLYSDKDKKPLVKDILLCGMCENAGYENVENLRRHMLAKHNLTYNEAATENKKIEENKEKVNKLHLQNMINKQKAENRKVKCDIKGCDVRFSNKELMNKHYDCHVDGDKKKFKCSECDKLFHVWRLCTIHMWHAHKIDIGLYMCSICNTFKCPSPRSLLVHMTCHYSEAPSTPFLCASCGKGFKVLSQLTNHEIHKHGVEGEKKLTPKKSCTTCEKVFANSKILKKHIQAVHNKYKPFICNICGHECARKAMLEMHLRQHTGEKPYKCEMCEYKTGDHNSLRRHLSRHYGFRKYSCPHCNYQTIQSSAYKIHIRRKHPGKDGFYSCKKCSFDSVNEQLYYDHLRTHSIEGDSGGKNNKEEPCPEKKNVPNLEDEETQTGLFSTENIDDMTIDTGGITIPAGADMQV